LCGSGSAAHLCSPDCACAIRGGRFPGWRERRAIQATMLHVPERRGGQRRIKGLSTRLNARAPLPTRAGAPACLRVGKTCPRPRSGIARTVSRPVNTVRAILPTLRVLFPSRNVGWAKAHQGLINSPERACAFAHAGWRGSLPPRGQNLSPAPIGDRLSTEQTIQYGAGDFAHPTVLLMPH
jgi:hypothetical protein